jgi:hypothetical protein
MNIARILVDPGRDDNAAEAGILLVSPFATVYRRDVDDVVNLTERFGPPEILDAELTELQMRTGATNLNQPDSYNLRTSFEVAVSTESRLVLLDVIEYPMYRTAAAASLERRIRACPWPRPDLAPPARAARVRQAWQTTIASLRRPQA